ncbi:MAG: DUF1801 domain-containing protein [Candidatus Kapabacteria bacterium]|nr:DUF1801 domain-containing protein [Candidatus Kapabacteria bacterium]
MNPLDEYITRHTPEQAATIEYLRRTILESHPGIEEAMKYGIPFFMLNGWLCYINPKKKELDIGFPRAQHFADPTGALQQKGRKMIKTLTFRYDEDIDIDALRSVLAAAIRTNLAWDETSRTKPKKKH